jgi:hypothetical protein
MFPRNQSLVYWFIYLLIQNIIEYHTARQCAKDLKIGGGDLTNVQCKPIWNCHNEIPPHKMNIS